ncbi:hypothetical protein Tco_0031396 [Tanacetum coccineum]
MKLPTRVQAILNKEKQIWKPKGKLSDNSLNKTKQIWKPKGKLSDNSLYKTKQVWKATGKLFADIGYQWRPTGTKLTLGKLDCGSQWRPTGKKFALGEMCLQVMPFGIWDSGCSKHYDGRNRSLLAPFCTISMDEMMMSSRYACVKASSPNSWIIFASDLVSTWKKKKFSHRPKSENTNMESSSYLHMDCTVPMRVQNLKGTKYILVIVVTIHDFLHRYRRYTERDSSNHVMSEFYEGCWPISSKSASRILNKNGGLLRRNRTLVEADVQ